MSLKIFLEFLFQKIMYLKINTIREIKKYFVECVT